MTLKCHFCWLLFAQTDEHSQKRKKWNFLQKIKNVHRYYLEIWFFVNVYFTVIFRII